MDTACYVTSATITIAASAADYTLDVGVLEMVEMTSAGSNITYGLERLSVGELLKLRRNAATATAPTLYYALAGQNLLMLHPAATAGDVFTLYYVPVPTALSASSDDPSTSTLGGIPAPFHKAIEYFACGEAGDANDDDSSKQGMKYFQQYEDQVKKIRRTLRRRGGSLMPLARVGPRSQRGRIRGLFHDNSIY
jgi:hypothetical protein